MLRILCILLKVLILMKADIAFSSEDVEDSDVIHYVINQSKLERVENYIDNVTVKNEVAPENIPTEPTHPRVFIEFEDRLKKTGNIYVKYRWNGPQSTNSKILKYTVRFWYKNQKKFIKFIHNVTFTDIFFTLSNIPDSMIYFQVQAYNENGAGPYSKFINVSSTHENPLPLLLISTPRQTYIMDMDLRIVFEPIEYRAKEIIYSALEHKVYWINEMSELISYDFDTKTFYSNRIYKKITDLDSSAHNLCIDWIARNLYWIQFSNHTRNIMKLDLTLWEQMGITKYDSFLEINESKFLNILPLEGYLQWMELNSNNQYVIRQSDFDGKNIKTFSEDKSNECFCPYKLREASSMQIDNTDIDNPLMYWTSKNHLIAGDIYGCKCHLILTAENQTFFSYLTIGKTNIYLFSNSEFSNSLIIYMLNKKYALLESEENAFTHVEIMKTYFAPIYSVVALDQFFQPYPQEMCLVPNVENYGIELIANANNIVVKMPQLNPNVGCEKYHLATSICNISISHCVDNNLNEFKNFYVLTHQRHYEIQNLTPLTEYKLKLTLYNFYLDRLSIIVHFGEDLTLKTIPGKLNAPENVTVQVLTPTLARIYWMPPKNQNCVQVNYQIDWTLIRVLYGMHRIPSKTQTIKPLLTELERTVDGKFFTTLESLLPGHQYFIIVRVYPANFSYFFTQSTAKFFYMYYMEPNNLTLSGVSSNSMNISWIPDIDMISYKLEYKHVIMQEWKLADNIEKNNDNVIYYIENLRSGSLYNFRLILRYPEYMEDFIWSPDERFTFKTLADIPSSPGKPMITRLSNSTYQLKWKSAQVHDSQVTLYRLEGLIVDNNSKDENQTNNWNLYYNGTDNHWIMTKDINQKYRFRVQAENAYGFGMWSETSAVIDLTESISTEILAEHYYYSPFVLSLIVTLVVYSIYYFFCSYGQHEKISEEVLPEIMTDAQVTRSEFSRGYMHLNKLYDSKLQHNLDEVNLKIIERNRITFVKLLGSGEFGKVFQGTVKNLGESGSVPVAIKMLRENASSKDKEKFLQEAKLMSYCSHKYVLTLLGTCLDIDSPLLILELMEGGDLLKYLTESRREMKSSNPNSLRLQDLLAMCEDVARGCCYLEELHFVHRDLACRNCLISTRNREDRIVKISDFGLARNLYKNSYYRTKGEDPLPLRWMAPESIRYRKFTSQSDVWSFGVVMWEITSLGEHPYFDKDNSEVLQYVCTGGKLPKPLNCPLELYQLMQHCWNAVDNRSNFMHCLENIVILKDNIKEDAKLILAADIIKYAELPSSGELEEFVEYIAHPTSERLTANDAPNDALESLT